MQTLSRLICTAAILFVCMPPSMAQTQRCGHYDCTDGTTVTFPSMLMIKAGEYSISVTLDDRLYQCRGTLNPESCAESYDSFICEGPKDIFLHVGGCQNPDTFKQARHDHDHIHVHDHDHGGHSDHHGHHGHDHILPGEEELLPHSTPDAPFVKTVTIMDAADDIDVTIKKREKILGGLHWPKTIFSQSYTPDYELFFPNGSNCPRFCKYGDLKIEY